MNVAGLLGRTNLDMQNYALSTLIFRTVLVELTVLILQIGYKELKPTDPNEKQGVRVGAMVVLL